MTVRLDLVGIITADLGRSLDFYRTLGLEIPAGAEDQPHVEVTLPSGLRLGWDTLATIQSFDPDFRIGEGRAPVALAFAFDSPAEVDEAYRRLADAGAGHLEPWDAFWGQRYAIVHDPDGNTIDLFAASA